MMSKRLIVTLFVAGLLLTVGSMASADTKAVSFKDSSGAVVVQFKSNGDVYVNRGQITASATDAQLAATSAKEVLVKKNSTIVMRIQLDTGNVYLKGTLTRDTALTSNSSKKEILFKSVSDTGTNVGSLIDEDGNLKFKGDLYIDGVKSNP